MEVSLWRFYYVEAVRVEFSTTWFNNVETHSVVYNSILVRSLKFYSPGNFLQLFGSATWRLMERK